MPLAARNFVGKLNHSFLNLRYVVKVCLPICENLLLVLKCARVTASIAYLIAY